MVDTVEAKLEEDRIPCGCNRAGGRGCGAGDNGTLEAAVITEAVRMSQVGLQQKNLQAVVEMPLEQQAIQKGCLEFI